MNIRSFSLYVLTLSTAASSLVQTTNSMPPLALVPQSVSSYARSLYAIASRNQLATFGALCTEVAGAFGIKKLAFTSALVHDKRIETEVERDFRTGDKALYLYCPGFLGNSTQAGKYSTEFVLAKTGETITSENGIQVLGKHVSTAKGNEVTDRPVKGSPFLSNPFAWFYESACYVIARRTNAGYGVSVSTPKESNSDTSVEAQSINPLKIVIGIDQDKENVIAAFKEMCAKNSTQDIVLYGVSRGTAAIAHALPELIKLADFKRVKGIVLEGAFDSMEHVYKTHSLLRIASWVLSFERASSILKWITGSDQTQNRPCDVWAKVLQKNKDFKVPLLIVGSKADATIRFECTQQLYDTIKKNAAEDHSIELVTLENSAHPSYMFDDKNDREKYQRAVHAFYKKHNLPHIKALAE